MRWFALALLASPFVFAQEKYEGPRPPKADIPYLLHADNLVETEIGEAREDKRKDDVTYVVSGASSPARTPLAEPILLFEADKIAPEQLELYRMEVKGGNRTVTVSKNPKRSAKPLMLTVRKLDQRLYRIEVNEGLGLERGEYSFSPQGSNAVFCFEVY